MSHSVARPQPFICTPWMISTTPATIIIAPTQMTVTAVASMTLSKAMMPQRMSATPRATAQPHLVRERMEGGAEAMRGGGNGHGSLLLERSVD